MRTRSARHSNGANLLFLDGHAGWQTTVARRNLDLAAP
ncbi:MAG: hypothetical protein GX595_13270 [Lentisphaerae bacterium]|nr:hypothetical protein [Lentisphaerota bacterium]